MVAISGPVGRSAAGLALLQAGGARRLGRAAGLVERTGGRSPTTPLVRRPPTAGATAMIDVSDGLVADLGHVAEASGVRLHRLAASLPGSGAAGGRGRQARRRLA